MIFNKKVLGNNWNSDKWLKQNISLNRHDIVSPLLFLPHLLSSFFLIFVFPFILLAQPATSKPQLCAYGDYFWAHDRWWRSRWIRYDNHVLCHALLLVWYMKLILIITLNTKNIWNILFMNRKTRKTDFKVVFDWIHINVTFN